MTCGVFSLDADCAWDNVSAHRSRNWTSPLSAAEVDGELNSASYHSQLQLNRRPFDWYPNRSAVDSLSLSSWTVILRRQILSLSFGHQIMRSRLSSDA